MKLNKSIMALATAAAFGLSSQAFAEGTAAGTSIDNTVTLGYSVNSVAQDDLTQNTAFLVDTKVDFTLTMDESVPVKVTPNGTGYIANYTLTSTSNDVLGFALSSADLGAGIQAFDLATAIDVTDTIDLNTSISVFVESGATAGYQSAEDTDTAVTALAADGTAEIYVVVSGTVTGTAADADIASIALTADAKQTDGTTTLDNDNAAAFIAGTKQFVIVTDTLTKNTAFEVGSAKFTDPDDATATPAKFTLDVIAINDPMCETAITSASSGDYSAGSCPDAVASYIPKAIPGAMVKYTLKAKNSGSINATNVTFTQDLANIPDTDGDSALDLVPGTLDNTAATFTGTATPTDTSDTNVLNIGVSTFEVDKDITITFTAIVE